MTDTEISTRKKIASIWKIAKYRPGLTALIVVFSVVAALLEGIGLGFLLPIIEIAQAEGDPTTEAEGLMQVFVAAYQTVGLPFTLEFVLVGVAAVMCVRFTASYVVAWFREILRAQYIGDLRQRGFEQALGANVAYFDEQGSDEILNAIITQTEYASRAIRRIVKFFEQSLISLMYLAIAFYFAPWLTVLAAVLLGGMTYFVRNVVEPGYVVGDRVAEANERIQEIVQAGTQGIRDVKLFGMTDELVPKLRDAVSTYVSASIAVRRNESGIRNFYQLSSAVTVFVLIYAALRFSSLSLAELGIFLFAMFRLSPRISTLNSMLYKIESDIPHFVRTDEFLAEVRRREEHDDGARPAPEPIEPITFDDVEFSYDNSDDPVLNGISFELQRNDYVAFVGPSGAGKSTIVSLLARLYTPDSGEIRANGVALDEIDLADWRSQIAVIRQNPHIFNDTLRFNLTVGDRDVSQTEIDRVCRVSHVDEFLEDLPQGYDTVLGDEGVQLSGGQRQRVALARALLTDSQLLVLDEATSDLDSRLERDVQRAIESVLPDYTIVVIAHRLSTITNADRIYTIEGGEISEIGSHEELVEADGRYAQLFEIQS